MNLTGDIAFVQKLQQIHEDCFDRSVCYRRSFFQLNPVVQRKPDDRRGNINLPTVACGISQAEEAQIEITFIIQNYANVISTPIFDKTKAIQHDFLWEKNCLELFLGSQHSIYYEINASLIGEFAIYQFDDYRNPNTLPPKASADLSFQWQNAKMSETLIYQFSVLFSQQAKFSVEEIQFINPTAILYQANQQDNQPIFYAVNHANPPDFHDKTHWLNF